MAEFQLFSPGFSMDPLIMEIEGCLDKLRTIMENWGSKCTFTVGLGTLKTCGCLIVYSVVQITFGNHDMDRSLENPHVCG